MSKDNSGIDHSISIRDRFAALYLVQAACLAALLIGVVLTSVL